MADIIGTNGNDQLNGTVEADRFVPLGGHDSVDGGEGSDTLIVDYTNYGYIDPYAGASVPNMHFTVVTSVGGSFDGSSASLSAPIR
jgi:Ca2+-binding RTX toxin-like protein